MPDVEHLPSAEQVRALLRSSRDLPPQVDPAAPLRYAATGWDNVVYRLGECHAVRLPVRRAAVPLLDNESEYLPVVAGRLAATGIGCPVPVFRGEPGHGYPWPWLVCLWVPGTRVSELPVPQRDRIATDLARAFAALHVPAPDRFPVNPFRGCSLAGRGAAFGERLPQVERRHGADAARRLRAAFDRGLVAPVWDGPPRWLHGDPHPLNLVTDGVRLTGLVDFGDITAGDPASDLSTAWLTLNRLQRNRFRAELDEAAGYGPGIWSRAAGWAAAMVAALDCDESSRESFASTIAHALTQL